MNKIILLLSFGLICLMGMASVSAVDVDDCVVDDCAVNDSVVCVSDVDAYGSADDNAFEDSNASHGGAIDYSGINYEDYKNCPYINNSFNPIDNDFEDYSEFQMLYTAFHIEKKVDGKKLDVKLFGSLELSNVPAFESLLNDLDNVEELTLDFKDVDFISIKALRVPILMQKAMTQNGGSMKLINVPDNIMYVFNALGLSKILTIEQ